MGIARLAYASTLLAALCTLHARTALPDTQPGSAPASVSEAAPDLTPLTSATSVPAPSDDGAGTLGRGQRGKVRGSFGNGGRGGAGLCVGQRGACVQREEGSQQGQGQGLAGQGLAAHRL